MFYTGQKFSDNPKPTKEIEAELQPADPEDLVHLEAIPNQYTNAKVGDKLIMNNLYFHDRSGIFVPESLPVMEELLSFMVSNPKAKIEIQGHICCQLGEDPEDMHYYELLLCIIIWLPMILMIVDYNIIVLEVRNLFTKYQRKTKKKETKIVG